MLMPSLASLSSVRLDVFSVSRGRTRVVPERRVMCAVGWFSAISELVSTPTAPPPPMRMVLAWRRFCWRVWIAVSLVVWSPVRFQRSDLNLLPVAMIRVL